MAIKEYIRYGSPPFYCLVRLPDWALQYDQVTVHDPNLGSTYLLAFDITKRSYSWNITYGYIRTTNAVNGVRSILTYGEWSDPEPFESEWIWTSSPYVDHSYKPCWTNKDIYGWGSSKDPNVEEYLVTAATKPLELVLETGWTDYGSDGQIMDLTDRTLTVPQGSSVAGAFRCSVIGASAESFTFEWYENGKLVSTRKNRTYSDYKPSAKKTGSFNIHCKVTSSDGVSLETDSMYWKVVTSGSGGGGSGGGTEDEVIGGGIILSSRVTDIVLTVSPDTVVPGGHSLIEVSVNGIGNYSQAFTAQIGGYASAATHLVTGGYGCNVWIAEDETADYVLVTVTSVQDPTITATEMIYIDQSATEEEDTAADKLQIAYWKGFATARAYFQQTSLSASASVRITRAEEEPSTEAGQLKRAFWNGFVACLGTFGIIPDEIIATLTDGVLYIEKAPAVLNGNTLEV